MFTLYVMLQLRREFDHITRDGAVTDASKEWIIWEEKRSCCCMGVWRQGQVKLWKRNYLVSICIVENDVAVTIIFLVVRCAQ